MSGDDETELVDNAYKLALSDVLPRVREQVRNIDGALEAVVTALENEAWVSTTADVFDEELRDHKRNSSEAGDDCEDAFQTAHDNEPDEVPDDHPKARWSVGGSYPSSGNIPY
ncbi:hypothetical protein [Phytoactinopolyspora mesophila]|uniref:Uncharacterized protein n=1 Tax=Phytoactinopolyspora mesophila TaxID=2650750 RepID=A0A7K3M6I9_9ACTN|nr:hypothetical protein [Phytoactinopolyspora mesophila]NDL58934.1 hypothetical protein [Phytoactinopolyspora mesophila]